MMGLHTCEVFEATLQRFTGRNAGNYPGNGWGWHCAGDHEDARGSVRLGRNFPDGGVRFPGVLQQGFK
jgi:hypothetical protein